MALVLADRVNETTTTAGTGTLTLAGAVSGYQSFSVVGNANTTYYTIVGQTTGEWEVGIGTYTSSGTTLSRDTVLASSAGGTTKVTLSAGTKFVFCDYPAGRAVYLDTASNATIPGITLSGGTANGVGYLNGSKVLTTGTALVFDGTTFTSTGSQGLLNTVGGNTARMVATAAGAYFGSTTAADVIFQYNSTEGMRLTSTGLGIGTSSPTSKLQVNGTGVVISKIVDSSATGYSGLAFSGTGTQNYSLGMGGPSEATFGVANKWFLYDGLAGAMRMVVDTSGNLGIGTTSPSNKLTVNGAASAVNLLQVTGTSGASQGILKAQAGSGATLGYNRSRLDLLSQAGTAGWSLYNYGDGGDLFAISVYGGSDAINVTQAGYVGIGTSSPSNPLTVSSDISAQVRINAISANVNARLTLNASGTGLNVLGTTGAVPLAFLSGSTEQMRLDTSGNLGLGVTPSAWSVGKALEVAFVGNSVAAGNAGQLNVTNNAFFNSVWQYANSSLATSVYSLTGGAFTWRTAPSGTAGNTITFTQVMTLTAAGRLGIGTTSPSDVLGISGGGIRIEGWNADITFIQQQFSAGYFQRVAGDSTNRQLRLESNSSDGGTSGSIAFRTSSSGTLATTMTLDGLGTLGVGITPNSWGGGGKAIQLPGGAISGYSGASNNQLILWNNCYYGTNFTYTNTDYANYFRIYNGTYAWFNAPSGTAGTTPTFTQVMTLTNGGYLGIGTTAPNYPLVVSSGGAAGVEISPTGGINSSAFLQCYNRSGAAYVPFTVYASEIYWALSGAEKMRLNTSGNLGIGTTTPGGKLTSENTSGITCLLRNTTATSYTSLRLYNDQNSSARSLEIDYSGSTYSGALITGGPSGEQGAIGTTGAYPLVLYTNNTSKAVINSTGNFAVGMTPSPWGSGRTSIQVYGSSTAAYFSGGTANTYFSNNFYHNGTNDVFTNATWYASGYQQSYLGDHSWVSSTAASVSANSAVTLTTTMTLTQAGNLLVGTTSAYNSAKVSVNGDVEARGNIKTRYGASGALANGASLTLMSFPNGSYGSQLDGVLVVEQRDDSGGNLTTSTYLVSAYGGSGANFTAVSTQTYAGGQSFTIGSTTSSGNLVISITNTSGRACTSVNYTFLALKGGSTITYAF